MATDEMVAEVTFTEDEAEALQPEAAITPYERLDLCQDILSDPAKAIAAFGGAALNALAMQFKDRDGKVHWGLTAEGAKAFLAKSNRPYRIHKPEYEEFEIDGQQWTRCIATVTLLDNGTEACDLSEKPRKDKYGNIDPFAGRKAFTSALARVAKTFWAGNIGTLEAFCTECANKGLTIMPGEAPVAVVREAKLAEAGRASERIGNEVERVGKERGDVLNQALRELHAAGQTDILQRAQAFKVSLGFPSSLKWADFPATALPGIERWFMAQTRPASATPTQVPTQTETDEPKVGETPPADPFPQEDAHAEDFGLANTVAAARDKGMSTEMIAEAQATFGMVEGITEKRVVEFTKFVAKWQPKKQG